MRACITVAILLASLGQVLAAEALRESASDRLDRALKIENPASSTKRLFKSEACKVSERPKCLENKKSVCQDGRWICAE